MLNKANVLILTILLLAAAATLMADDLYQVKLYGHSDAETLISTGVRAALVLNDGYLVLAGNEEAGKLELSGLDYQLIAVNVKRSELALDHRNDLENAIKYDLIYEKDNLRLFKTTPSKLTLAKAAGDLSSIDDRYIEIKYRGGKVLYEGAIRQAISYDSLIGLVLQDSVEAYSVRLQEFDGRVTGTDSCFAARDWIAAKFASFGYDSILIDTFTYSSSDEGYNVVAFKAGTRYPDQQIIVGGHYDAVLNSPGADDNGSGTAATLEIARALKDIQTEKTIVFIAFDAEEVGLIGSADYAAEAAARGNDIQYMLNMDMIGYMANDTMALLYYGPEIAYSQLWGQLAAQYAGITGILKGQSGSSDHAPFIQNGFAATFVHEYVFSTVYHTYRDSIDYLNFDYMTRMIQASLATVYTVDFSLPPVSITAVRDGGDGQSVQVNWAPLDPGQADYYYLYWTTVPAAVPDSVLVPPDNDIYLITGLTAGQEYSFYLVAFDNEGHNSIVVEQVTCTPLHNPRQPSAPMALPVLNGVKLWWQKNNTELDFDHYSIIRDGSDLSVQITDSFYIDNDPSLGNELHDYIIRAVDSDENYSDTAGVMPTSMKAATLQPDRILALNRTANNLAALVDEGYTGAFLEDALYDLNFDYYSDTAYSLTDKISLVEMVDYGLLIIGAESGVQDDIGNKTEYGGILDSVAYYLSLGGKAIIFGRWGDLYTGNKVDTVYFTPGTDDFAYTEYFNIAFRIRPLTLLDANELTSDFYGAHSQAIEYPDLVWDSTATANHSLPFTVQTGIPCPTLPALSGAPVDIIYTYNSASDSLPFEGKPVAWRYRGGSYEYVYFELPLSFMERDAAIAALRQAVSDMGISTAVDEDLADEMQLPETFELFQNYPNPFNQGTVIEFFNPQAQPTPVKLEIFNIIGQRVKLLFDELAAPGINSVSWDGLNDRGESIASGIYFYRLDTGQSNMTRRMILLK